MPGCFYPCGQQLYHLRTPGTISSVESSSLSTQIKMKQCTVCVTSQDELMPGFVNIFNDALPSPSYITDNISLSLAWNIFL